MPGYTSEVDYDGGANSNFVEIAVPRDTDTSGYSLVVYDKDGTIIETFSLGPVLQTISGQDVYLIDGTDPDWVDIHNDEALALVDDTGTVIQFISFKDPVTAVEGPADGMSATQVGEHSGSDESLVTGNGGNSYSATPSSTPGTIPCFAVGTLIATPDGLRPVESLNAGDLVCTIDDGPKPILWTRANFVSIDSVGQDVCPVLIRRSALSDGCPKEDLIVSPQHRILVGETQLEGLLPQESLGPAKALTDLPGIRRMRGKTRIEWIHFAFDRHQLVYSNGCITESLLLGPMVISGLSAKDRADLRRIVGTTGRGAWNGPPARDLASVGTTRARIKRFKQQSRTLALAG